MTRSQLLKDIVSGQVSIENVLLRLKVILSDLDNDLIMMWVNGELQGYKEIEDLPEYRIIIGHPIGTYIVNYSIKYSDANVPLEHLLDKDKIKDLTTLYISDGIGALQKILSGENRNNYARVVPTAYCHAISTKELQLTGMRIQSPPNLLDGIISNVTTKLVDVVMELEKQFENLDELDIKQQVEGDKSKKENVIYNIEQIIYEGSISLGDKNKISKSKFGHLFGGGRK